MNEELQKALAELLSKANNGIDAAGNFLEAELPEVISQLLMWHGVYNFIIMFWAPIYIFIMYRAVKPFLNPPTTKEDAKKSQYYCWNDYSERVNLREAFAPIGSMIFLAVFGTVGAISTAKCLNLEWLQIWIAPKVWLLEYAANLAK